MTDPAPSIEDQPQNNDKEPEDPREGQGEPNSSSADPYLHYVTARNSATPASVQWEKISRFVLRHLACHPSHYSSLDTCRITLLFFNLGTLDLLNRLDDLILSADRQRVINWIYSLQICSTQGAPEDACGFRGSFSHAPAPNTPHSILSDGVHYDEGNLAQTYSALICLCIVGDDLKRVNRQAILTSIRKCQMEKGCFSSQSAGSEHDMRFVFCAVAICYILGDDSAIDWKKLAEFIRGAVAYDGGIGQTPGDESHGGSTYCAVASLALANRLWDGSVLDEAQLKKLVRWAVLKQERGFHGRANKEDDSCYGFWIGGTLEILNSHSLIGHSELRSFLHEVQHPALGGFCKLAEAGKHPDNLHTYFSLAALSLLREPGIAPVFAPLNCSRRVHEAIARRRVHFAQSSS